VRAVSFDLHIHSLHSDGTTTPTENAALAAAAGVSGLALTDHDTTEGFEEAARACGAHGLTFVPGVELSTELDERSVHVLGYWVDPTNPALAAECARLRNERWHRAQRIVGRLHDHGLAVDFQQVLARAGDAPIGRPHIAAAMVDAGVVADRQEAFDGWLCDGGLAWVPKHAIAPVDGVRLIRGAGGVSVLAHPGLSTRDARIDDALVDELAAAGLAGLEADHVGHDAETAAAWRTVAERRGLLVTGASDFHGSAEGGRIGERTTPDGVVAALQERIDQPSSSEAVARESKEQPW
jgi:predicted metal-dependent phosphoesterase TrpH